jgi:hypothetical protein
VEVTLRGREFRDVSGARRLDRLLLRPRSVLLQVAAFEFEARKLARIAQAGWSWSWRRWRFGSGESSRGSLSASPAGSRASRGS